MSVYGYTIAFSATVCLPGVVRSYRVAQKLKPSRFVAPPPNAGDNFTNF